MSWREENAWEQAYNEWEDDLLLQRGQWKNGKNEIVSISELSTQHIVNIINKIKRDKWRVDYLGIMERELMKRI